MTKWEYTTTGTYQEIHRLGKEGWELVQICVYPPAPDPNAPTGVSVPHTFYLKRPKTQWSSARRRLQD